MISQQKQILRRRVRDAVRAMSEAKRASESEKIAVRVRDWIGANQPALVLGFVPMADEPDWLQGGAGLDWDRLAFPVIGSDGLEFYRIRDFSECSVGRFGILTPPAWDGRRVCAMEADCILVPGMAFDRRGARLGRGGGYYDRLLANRPAVSTALGVAFSEQIVESIPEEPHDLRVDVILAPEPP